MKTLKLYQPVPFSGQWDSPTRSSKDCEERWQSIRQTLNPHSKTLVDLGCANGFFMFRFLQDGGLRATGLEIDSDICDFVNQLAISNIMNIDCYRFMQDIDESCFDVGFYLDLHYHDGINFLPWIKSHTEVLYASCSGDGEVNTPRFLIELKALYKNVTPLVNNYNNRTMFRCE